MIDHISSGRPGLAFLAAGIALVVASASAQAFRGEAEASGQNQLRDVSSFDGIRDRGQRSAALFTEAGKVIMHPRCMNCHPATRRPTQGDDMHPHEPPMVAGAADHGPVGLACSTCHGAANVDTFGAGIKSIPGDPHWALAPASMSWQGKTLPQICAQITDLKRNGNRTLKAIHHHMSEDHLVGWAWRPGPGRQSAPGTQAQFGALIQAWIDTGARCPAS